MATVTYNTTRYQSMTRFTAQGSIYMSKLIDSTNESDVQLLAEMQDQRNSPERTFVRPASVATVDGEGSVYVDRCDAVEVGGKLIAEHSGFCQGECDVNITPFGPEKLGADIWSEETVLPAGVTVTVSDHGKVIRTETHALASC